MSNEKKEINKDKLKALEITIGKIEKDFGKGTIMKLGDQAVQDVRSISTGSVGLDMALGIGGIPTGSFGENHTCNTGYCRGAKGRRCCCHP